MKTLILLSILSLPAFSAEVTTIEPNVSNTELIVVSTEDLQVTFDKAFFGHPCKPRVNLGNMNFKEFYLPVLCRAELTKLILNAGYKSIDRKTFIK